MLWEEGKEKKDKAGKENRKLYVLLFPSTYSIQFINLKFLRCDCFFKKNSDCQKCKINQHWCNKTSQKMRKKMTSFKINCSTEYRTSWQSAEHHTLTRISTKKKIFDSQWISESGGKRISPPWGLKCCDIWW